MERDNSTTSITGICFEGYYVIQDNETCKLIALDKVSGGYYYMASFPSQAKFWRSFEEADKFRKTMRKENEWTICISQFHIKQADNG